ncbi:MAG: tyrosine--tRNA ligase [Patescibacteria group bacterium]
MTRPHWKLAVDRIYPNEAAFLAAAVKPLRVYFGIDPTGTDIHIGHGSTLRVLRTLQEEGHTVVFLFGDFTARVGDPTGRNKERVPLSREEVRLNMATYLKQIATILDIDRIEVRENSEWYESPDRSALLSQFLELGKHFTAAQLWERDMFQERQKAGQPVTLTEFIYPMLQANDSIELDVDMEVGGTDQTFNMLAGRDLFRKLRQKEKYVLTTKLLTGTDGRKMSKSFENAIWITDSPEQMFGKLMSIADALLPEYCALAAGIDPEESAMQALITSDPRAAKAKMAYEVVTFYHGAEAAEVASRSFDTQFRDGGQPAVIPEGWPSVETQERLTFFLVDLGLVSSKAEAARLVSQGAVRVDDVVVQDQFAVITPVAGMLVQVGKRHFLRLVKPQP